MKRFLSSLCAGFAVFIFVFPVLQAQTQGTEIKPVLLGQALPDFTLPSLQGGEVTLSGLKGKNVIILFPRGYAAEGRWCTICHYQVVSLTDLEKKEKIQKKYDAQILIVLPYTQEQIQAWFDVFPEQLQKIHDVKNPADPGKLDDASRQRTERFKTLFPKDILWKKEEARIPFPILIDVDRKVSKGLGLFASEWGGSKVDQNMPSVFILDKSGILRFKYIGQNTADRPSAEYVEQMLAFIAAKKK